MSGNKKICCTDEKTVSSDETFVFTSKRKPDPFFFDDSDDGNCKAKKQKCISTELGATASAAEHLSPLVNSSEVTKVQVQQEWMPIVVHVSGSQPELIDLTEGKGHSVPGDAKSIQVINLTQSGHQEGDENSKEAAGGGCSSTGPAEDSKVSDDGKSTLIDLTSGCVKEEGSTSAAGGAYNPEDDVIDLTKNPDGSNKKTVQVMYSPVSPVLYSPASPANSEDFLEDIPDPEEQNQLMNKECLAEYNMLLLGKMIIIFYQIYIYYPFNLFPYDTIKNNVFRYVFFSYKLAVLCILLYKV